MPTPATDRPRVALLALAAVSVGLALLSVHVANGAAAAVEKPIPAADLQGLSDYLVPLPDSTSLAAAAPGTMVVATDPFGSPGSSAPAMSRGTPASAAQPAGGTQWVVSSILFEDSKRSAIVNDAWVNVGDPLAGGARVTAIERKYVVVTEANGVRHVVPIQGGAL